MSVLVTGGNGFIGRYVVARLRDMGETVLSVDRAVGVPAGVHGIVDTAEGVGRSQLLRAARRAGFAGRIVLVSSRAGAGETFGDLDVVSLRFGAAYGPGRRLPDLLEEIIDAAKAGRPLRIDADAAEPLCLVHVDDVARAIVAALRAPAPAARAYDIAGEPVRLQHVVAIVRDRVPHAAIQLHGTTGSAVVAEAATAADRDLGYRPRWGLARGLDDLWIRREAEEGC